MWTGAEVRDLRVRLGWTQQKLADHLGVASKTVMRWESERFNPLRAYWDKLDELSKSTAI